MSIDDGVLLERCVECNAVWHPTNSDRWRAYLGCDEYLDGPAEVVFYCPHCAER